MSPNSPPATYFVSQQHTSLSNTSRPSTQCNQALRSFGRSPSRQDFQVRTGSFSSRKTFEGRDLNYVEDPFHSANCSHVPAKHVRRLICIQGIRGSAIARIFQRNSSGSLQHRRPCC